MDRIMLFYMSETCVVDDAPEGCEAFDACILICLFPSFLTQAETLQPFCSQTSLQLVRQMMHLPCGRGEGWLQLSLI